MSLTNPLYLPFSEIYFDNMQFWPAQFPGICGCRTEKTLYSLPSKQAIPLHTHTHRHPHPHIVSVNIDLTYLDTVWWEDIFSSDYLCLRILLELSKIACVTALLEGNRHTHLLLPH